MQKFIFIIIGQKSTRKGNMKKITSFILGFLIATPALANDTYAGLRIHKNESLALKYDAIDIESFKLRKDNFGIGAVVGNRLSDNVKIEFETSYTGMKEAHRTTALDFDIWANMFNVYLFQEFDGAIAPYAGMGIGFAAVWGNVNAPYANISDSVFDLSFQVMLGVNFALNDKVDLNLGVKYQYYGEVEFKKNGAEFATTDVDGTEFYFGAVYKFSM